MATETSRLMMAASSSEMGTRQLTKKEEEMINKHLKTKGKTVYVNQDSYFGKEHKNSDLVKVVKL